MTEGPSDVNPAALQKALDKADLRALVDAYATTVDARDDAGFAALFAEGATMQVVEANGNEVPTFSGDDIPGALAPLSQYLRTQHLMANHTVQLDGDRGTGQVQCLARHLRKIEDETLDSLLMVIRYEDEYVRTAQTNDQTGGWRFASRSCRIQWMEVHPASLDLGSF